MKYKTIIVGMLCCLLSGFSLAEVMVVAHVKSNLSGVELKTLKKVFLGKTSKIAGMNVTAVTLPDANAIKIEFDQKALNKDPGKMKAYWSNRIFTGKGKPLAQVSDEAEMLKFLAADKSAVGYMSADALTSNVKVLLTIP